MTSHARVEKKNTKASFFKPSQYKIIGFPKTNPPVIVAETTNKRSIMIGIRKLDSPPKIAWLLKPSIAIVET